LNGRIKKEGWKRFKRIKDNGIPQRRVKEGKALDLIKVKGQARSGNPACLIAD